MKHFSDRRFARILALVWLVIFSVTSAQCATSGTTPLSVPPGAIPSMDELAGDWQKASEIRSLPAVNNALGSAQAARDVLAVGNLSFPPITMAGDTGGLLIDGKAPVLEETRWYPHQISRRASSGNLGIETAVCMMYDQRALLFHIVLTNRDSSTQSFQTSIALSANTSRHNHWGWKVPRDSDSNHFSFTLDAVMNEGRSFLLRDSSNELANCFCFEHKPDELSAHDFSGAASWRLTLPPQESININYVLVFGGKQDAVHNLAVETAAQFDDAFARVQHDWQERFDAMFTPGNSFFSGHLPVLVTPDKDMRRVYYMSVMSLLSVLRTGFPLATRVYVSNTPESNCTMMYFWDTREWATVFALLDPVVLKECLRSWLARGIHNGYAEEYLTGTLQGPWYSANDYSVFILLDSYLNVTGDRAFLSEKINGHSVLEHMHAIATHWKELVRPDRTLADYGGPANLLECVPTYINEVPSFNAANVWMMRRVSDIQAAEGNAACAADLRSEARRLLPAVLALYEPGQGVWNSLHRDGTRIQMRHVFDFATIGLTINNDLPPNMREEMTAFVERELLTDHWMRAQSLSDPAAGKSDRPDHGPMGAFCAWPAETMAAMCELGASDKALDFLHRCADVTREGPFSQSRELLDRTADAPVRIVERGSKGLPSQTYNASNGGSFAETIIRGFFGYQPNILDKTLVHDPSSRHFSGQLLNVRQDQHLCDISSTEQGLQISPAKWAETESGQ